MVAWRNNLIAKVSLVLLCTVALGFAGFTFVHTRSQVDTMRRAYERTATGFARGITAGLRNAMLSGNGRSVEAFLEDTRRRIPDAEIHVYSNNGKTVFEPHVAPIETAPQPSVLEALEHPGLRISPKGIGIVRLANTERCRTCHEESTAAGALEVAMTDDKIFNANSDKAGLVVAQVVRTAFLQLMTSGHEPETDAMLQEIGQVVPGVQSVSVLGISGTVSYGDPALSPIAIHKQAIEKKRAVFEHVGSSLRWALPLENGPRCRHCHARSPEMRGSLVISFNQVPSRETLLSSTEVSFNHVMLSGLGRLVVSFLDEVGQTEGIDSVALYDPRGHEYHSTRPSTHGTPALVERALVAKQPLLGNILDPTNPRLSYVEPLENDQDCRRCHGVGKPLRGLVEVTLDTTREREERHAILIRGAVGASLTILIVLLVVYGALRRMVLQPVFEMGGIAERVGRGDLTQHVPVRSLDEIGQLALRINEMIGGLRKKLELGKFVSRETFERVEAVTGRMNREGTRCRIAVLFSDIRGFTVFSEQREPEEVVEMLNQYLAVQAEIVTRHGGDIDKYVGDELMARFSGPDMEARAIRAGVEMVAAVEQLAASREHTKFSVAIGIGINAGDVVMGAMGSQERMDFTVIGDSVNVGARLCSAAAPGQVLISHDTAQAAGIVEGIAFETMAPLTLKGKREPLAVVTAKRG